MKQITKKKLGLILATHTKWLYSFGKEGKFADLTGANLRYANFGKLLE